MLHEKMRTYFCGNCNFETTVKISNESVLNSSSYVSGQLKKCGFKKIIISILILIKSHKFSIYLDIVFYY